MFKIFLFILTSNILLELSSSTNQPFKGYRELGSEIWSRISNEFRMQKKIIIIIPPSGKRTYNPSHQHLVH